MAVYYGIPRNEPYIIPRQKTEDFSWLRSREYRHRQAHYYDLGNTPGVARSVCRRHDLKMRELTRYKEYTRTPSNACQTCAAFELNQCMEGLAK
jgi:hypothetical protein